jgi:plastocyanin
MHRTTSLLLVAALTAGLVGCGDDDSAEGADVASSPAVPGQPVAVEIDGFRFQPADVEVDVGEEVVWTNGDDFAHTAMATDESFDTGDLAPGATSAPVSFEEPGTYSYFCGIHNSMTGTVTVIG